MRRQSLCTLACMSRGQQHGTRNTSSSSFGFRSNINLLSGRPGPFAYVRKNVASSIFQELQALRAFARRSEVLALRAEILFGFVLDEEVGMRSLALWAFVRSGNKARTGRNVDDCYTQLEQKKITGFPMSDPRFNNLLFPCSTIFVGQRIHFVGHNDHWDTPLRKNFRHLFIDRMDSLRAYQQIETERERHAHQYRGKARQRG